jgi:hypothetical protein
VAPRLRVIVLRFFIWTALLSSSTVQAGEFLRLCEESKAKAAAFLGDCRKDARPFRRNFLPGGRGEPVPENHLAWFDTASAGSHFGYGCVLGPRDEVRFLGLYFFLDRTKFLLANSLEIAFVDLNGNVGLRLPGGALFTALAVHRLSIPGRESMLVDRNCEIGRFDRASNETVERSGHGFRLHRVGDGAPANITTCIDTEIRYREGNCSTRTYRSFLTEEISPMIYASDLSLKITEAGRLYVDESILRRFCAEGARPALEFLNFVKELCGVAK